jgi:hypothetical protein
LWMDNTVEQIRAVEQQRRCARSTTGLQKFHVVLAGSRLRTRRRSCASLSGASAASR